jgi:hypothetical protein
MNNYNKRKLKINRRTREGTEGIIKEKARRK